MRRLALLCLLFTAAVQAEVFRWTDKDGVVHYADKPLVPEARPAALPALQTYQAGSPPPLIKDAAPVPAGIRISAPAADSIIRDAGGRMTIEVAAAPADGQGLIYYLDDVAQNRVPTPSTALLLNTVRDGAHSISVALVDAQGHELARAAAVKVRVQAASAAP